MSSINHAALNSNPIVPYVPEDLKQYPQFVVWKEGKIPVDPKTGKNASITDPDTWSNYETACRAYLTGHYCGIGFVFTENDPFIFLDIDDCLEGRVIPP